MVLVTRYNVKFRELLPPKRRKRKGRRLSSRLARPFPGAHSKRPEAPRTKPFSNVTWDLLTLDEILGFVIFVICFAILLTTAFRPNLHGLSNPLSDFDSPGDVIDSAPSSSGSR